MLLLQLESFIEVARLGNVSRAAETLFVTQPALTGRLKSLEQELGVELLLRNRRGVRLTEAGHAFLPYARRVIQAAGEGVRLMSDLQQGWTGALLVGATPAVSASVLPEALRRFRDANPQVRLGVQTGHSEQVLELVLREDVQLGIIRDLHHSELERIPLYEDELVLVVEPHHRLAKLGSASIVDLASEQLVLFDQSSSLHDITDALFSGAGVVPRGIIELDNTEAAKKMVEHGLGVAILPISNAADGLARGALRQVILTDAIPLRRRIVAVRRKDAAPLSAPLAKLLEDLRDIGAQASAQLAPQSRARRTRPRERPRGRSRQSATS